ncbi:protein AHNAK2 [Delphinus delphis]|uniref:protein AHNAK2 n=1 Tax=Delphinus delphis TaxID=9728 RepID=UPI0028C3B3F1|nr:protein AHNAK2 [Delphinus delphis]
MCDCFHMMLPTWSEAPGSVTPRAWSPGGSELRLPVQRGSADACWAARIQARSCGSAAAARPASLQLAQHLPGARGPAGGVPGSQVVLTQSPVPAADSFPPQPLPIALELPPHSTCSQQCRELASSWWSPPPTREPSERPGAFPCCHPTSGRSGLPLSWWGPASQQLLPVPVALSKEPSALRPPLQAWSPSAGIAHLGSAPSIDSLPGGPTPEYYNSRERSFSAGLVPTTPRTQGPRFPAVNTFPHPCPGADLGVRLLRARVSPPEFGTFHRTAPDTQRPAQGPAGWRDRTAARGPILQQPRSRAFPASGRQLQPEEPDAETAEDQSVTEGSVDEIIRPRPQGSSPVYEYVTEGAGFGLPEDTPRRRRSWWKRDSGDSQTLSRMTRPTSTQEAMEGTLKTKVEAGASGYLVTGGGDQGIFVKQVLKESSAAKLFSLREGDQLLSTTIFFDDIKYEDALKILQYSEPYKVQFTVRRQLPAREDEEGASGGAPRGSRGSKKQDQDIAEGRTETPTETLQEDGDQERLISKPREGRGRQPQRERLSWPKFQALKSKRGPGPRRSHSSSEASERGDVPDLSPTSTDTEAQLPEAGPGRQRKKSFPNLRFRVGSGKGLSGRGAHGGTVQAGVLVETGPRDSGREASRAAAHGGREDRTAGVPEAAEPPTEPGLPTEGAPGEGAGPAPRPRRKTKEAKDRGETVPQGNAGLGPAPGQSRKGAGEGTQSLELGIARLSLQDSADQGIHQNHQPEFHVRIPTLKTPKFGLYKEKVLEKEGAATALQQGPRQRRVSAEGTEAKGEDAGEAEKHRPRQPPVHPPVQEGGATEEEAAQKRDEDSKGRGPHTDEKEGKMKMLRFKLPSFGWSPAKEAKGDKATQLQETEKEKESSITVETLETDVKGQGGLERDSKFQMPRFKMPSFRVSAPSKSVQAAVEVSVPKAQAEVTLTSVQADVKTSDLRIEQLSAELEVKATEVGVKLPEGHHPKAEPKEAVAGIGLKGHLPKVQMPSIKAPQVDIKGPKLDLKDAKGEVTAHDVEVSLPSVEVDTQAAGTKLEGDMSLGDKEVAARDSKFKMPKFKMPSFGVSASSKSVEASLDGSGPKDQAEVTLPSVKADVKTSDLSIELPSTELDVKAAEVGVKLPEGHLPEAEPKEAAAGIGLKGHLSKVQMPSIKVPEVDIKGPKLDLKDAKGDVKVPDVEVSLSSMEVDSQAEGIMLAGDVSLGDKEVAARDSKFKMPKFKMPSFGMSAPSKSVQAAMEVSVPKAQAEVTRPSVQADVKTSDFSIELPSSKLEVKAAEVGLKLPEGHLPEVEPTEAAAVIGLKGHLSKVQMPSIKVPKVDIKAPQVDIKGPKLDLKDAKGEVTTPDMQVSLPSVEVDTQAAGIMLAGDVSLGDKEVATRDSKFKMPKFKKPSFGVSAPSKSVQAAMEVSVPKAQAEVTLPSVQADVKTSDLSIELPSTELDVKAAEVGVKLPEGHLPEAEMKEAVAGIGLKGHLPKVQMPSIKVPKVDIKGPQVDIKGPKLELQDAKGEVTTPDVEVSLPSVEVDSQVADSKLAGKVSLGDKEVAARDSKFKMPKFKMPSFGLSAPSKSVEASLEGSGLKTQAEVTLHSVQGDVKTSDLSIELPSAELEVKAAEVGVKLPEGHLPEAEPKEVAAGIGLKGHLPKVQMPSIKVPKVDIKGPKLDLKEAKGEVTVPDVEVSLPSVEVDTKAAGIMLAGDVSLGDKEVAARDSKFKMPKFKMPSVGVSAPSKSVKATVEVSVPKAQAKVTRPSVQADVKTSDLSIELPSSKLEVKAAEVGLKLPEGHLLEAESTKAAAEIGLKGHLSKVQMPSIKVPMVDIKGPKLDLKDPKSEVTTPYVEVSLPSVEVDTQAAGTKLEGDVSLGDKEVAARDSKFKMPQFKMPSFGVSSPSKSAEASLDGSGPKDQAEVTLPSVQADVKTSDISIELPSTELDVKAAEVGLKLPEGHLPEAEPTEAAAEIGLKGHLSKVQMPSIKVPKVDIKGPKLDLKDAKSEVTVPDVEVSLPSVEVDSQAADIMLAGDVSLGDKEVAVTDSKFKMPKFKMPSFGVSAPSKSVEASLEGSGLKTQAEVTLPSVQGDVKTSDLSIELPSAELDVKAAEVGLKLPEGHLPEAEPTEAAAGIGLKGHLPKVQMPSIKVPKVDIKGPKLDLKEAKGEVTVPDVEVSLPSMEVDTKAAGIMLAGDVSLGDKEVAARDSKFKMPKFKMPSVGVSAPSKSVKATVEVSVPKAQAKVTRPSVQADVKTSDLSIELPSSKLEVKAAEVGLKLPEGHLSEAESTEAAAGIGLKGHLSKVQMPSIKVPKVDLKGPKLDLQDAKGEVMTPDMEVSLPSVEVDTQVADSKLAGDVSLGDKEVAARNSKFKMPKFKMPSFGVSAPSRSVQAAMEVSVPKAQAKVTLPSMQADVKNSVSIELPSTELDGKAAEVGVKLPEGHLPEVEPKEAVAGSGLKGHLSKLQMPSIKVPKVDIKAPQVDIKGPKLELQDAKGEVTTPDVEVSLPSVEVDSQVADSKLAGDVSLGDKEVAVTDSKFKMPKFKMPSFGVSAPSKSVEASLEGSGLKTQAEVTLPSVQGDVKTSDLSIQLPSAELEVKAAEVGLKLPEGHLPEVEPKEAAAGIGLKGHLSKVQMPSIKVPKVDLKGPKLDLKDAKGEVTTPDMEVSLPSVEVDTQAAGTKLEGDVSLGDKEVATRDSKFKMPKFKMPSFGVSAPSKSVQAAMEVSVPKAQAEVTLPSVQADVKTSVLSIEQPSTELDVKAAEVGVKLPEGQLPEVEPKEAVAGIGLKGHLSKVQMPSIKVPKVDIKAPQVDIKGPKLDLKEAKGEVTVPDVEVSLPSVEVDTKAAGIMLAGDVSLGDKEVAARDSKFKMPKFKMPSFGASVPSKSVQAAMEVSVSKAQAKVTLPSMQADVKNSVSIELPSTELDVKAAEVGMKLPEGHLPEAEMKEAVAGIGLKGHLPKVQMPSIKVPKVDIKGPQVEIKGPKLDLKDAKGEVTTPDMEVSLPSVEVDTKAADIMLAGDVSLGDKEVAARDSKFKMPKFKMPSVGVSAPSKSVKATAEVSVHKAQAKVTRPSVQADVKTSDLSIELPSSKLEVKATEVGLKLLEGHLPEVEPTEAAAVIGLKGHLSKVQMPSIKVPKVDIKAPQVDIKAPQVDIKGPKLDLKDAKGEVTTPDMQVSLPSVEVDTQAAGTKLVGDVSLGDKEVAARDSKFKMPKFKMPSFGVSAPSKSVQAAMEVSVPKAQAKVTLPSVQADVKTSDLSIELPSTELDVKAAEVGVKLPEGHLPEAEIKEAVAGIGLKGHLPKVQMPSIKLPKVDIKGPQVDIKGPKLELQDAKGEVTIPDVEVSLPSVEVDSQVADSKLAGDVSLGDKEVAVTDSKFKMPKFKMPSFGVSAPSKSVEASLEGSGLKTQAEVTLPSVQGNVKTSDLSIELPSAELDVKAAEVGVKLPEGHLPEAEPKEAAAGIGLKGHLPKVQMPSIKVPKVDIKGPKLDLQDAKGEVTTPDMEVSLPSMEVDTKAAGTKLEGDVSLGDKEVAARDSKFKMPKFKMPSFGVSAPSKSVQAAMEVSVPKAQPEVTLPSVQADVKTSVLSIELPSSKLEVKATEVGLKLPEGHLREAEIKEAVAGIGLKGHLPKVQMPSIKVPKVDIKGPQVDIKGPKLDLKDAKGEVTTPDMEVSLPSVEVDTQAADIMLVGDVSLGDKEVAARDSKFKMPKFKMPSVGVSAPSNSVKAAMEVSVPKAQAEVTRPSVQADVKTSDLSIELPSSKLEVKAAEVGLKFPEGHLPEVEPTETAAEVGLKGHLSKVQMPSIKVPKVDIKGPKLDLQDAKGEVMTPYVEVSLPSVEVDTQATGTKLEGDVSLGDKEVAARDSKFKMPKFKMPSFGVSVPSKSVQAAMEVSVPKAQAEVTLPSVQADVKTSDLSIELPSAELDVKAAEVGLKLLEGHLPEVEPTEAAAVIGLKGHLSKVQMPSIKVPKVDLKGPKLDRQDAKGEVTTPNVEVLLPSVEVDTQAAGTKLESDVSLGDKEVAAKDSKFKMPKCKMPSFGVSAPSKSVEATLEESVPNVQAQVTLPSVQADVKTSALSIELPSTELEVKGAKVGVKLPEGHLLRAEPREVALGIALKGHLPKLEKPSIKVPKVDIEGPKLDLKDAKGEVLTKYQVTLPGAAVSPGLPLEAAPCSQNDAYLPSSESSASLPTQERVAASQTDSPAGPVDPMFLASYGRVSFPKFHPPKFGFSVPEAADAEVEAGPGGCAPSLSTTGPARGLDSTAVPRSAWPSAVAAGESPAKDTERGGKDSPLKMPWIKLPSFSWSPEKGAVPPEDPECSLDDAEIGVAVDTGHKGVPPGRPVSAVEVAVDALPEKDGEESGVGSPGCAVLEHAPLTGLTPEGGPGLPRGDPAAPRSRPPAGGGAPEGADVDPHLPQAHAPLLDFVRPDLRPSKAKVGGSSSAGGPPSPGHSSQGHGLRDGPASQPLGEAMAPSVGDPQQPSCSPADVDAPAVESVASQGGWFRMPALRLPSLRRPARERGAAGARGAPVPAPAASTLREGESPAPVRGQGVPGSEVEEAMSLQPPEAGADEAAAELASHADADVLKRGPEDKRSELHLSPAGAPAAGLSPSEARVRPGEGSLPLQMPSGRLSGTQAPPAGPAGPGLAAGQGRAEEWPSQPEGPIKLKASRTDGPSQVSVVNMGQPWEGSVVTVRLPRLSVPRFAFPDPSSEADVFIPAVTEVQCPGSSLAHALHEGSPGVWGASILRAGAGTPGGQPVALGFSPEASPISEVRVHVQRAQGEGPEVAVHSRVTAELADLSGPEAISTQVVRQLEIPASEIQTASYGFSLLKVKVPEPRTRVSVRDSRLRDGLQEASQQAAPGAEPASGGPQPDTTGPSEVISPSVDVPGQPTFTPKVHSGRQGADSCCDKAEGAEVLAFPPKEASGEAATSRAEEGSAPGEKPGGRRSGLFRFWLPNIGFSSSAEEPRADSKGEARAAAALQTQPGARPEAELPRKPQRAGWLRFPTLGLSSSPTKKSESSEDEAALAEQNAQEQAVTFFDAPESFSPEGEGAGGPAETAGARAMATSTARTGLVLLEQDPEGGMHLHPGPPQSEDRQTDERRPSEAPTVRTRVSTLIHSTESEAEVPESGGAPPSHSPPEVGPQTRRPPRASAAEAAPRRPTRPQPHAGSCAPDGLCYGRPMRPQPHAGSCAPDGLG